MVLVRLIGRYEFTSHVLASAVHILILTENTLLIYAVLFPIVTINSLIR